MADWPQCSAETWAGRCRSVVAQAGVTVRGEKATPHESGLCPTHLREAREAESATVVEAPPAAPLFAIEWEDKPENAGKPWRDRIREDFHDREDAYIAFRAAIVSGLNATKGVTERTKCKCGKTVTLTLALPDAAQITKAAKDLLSELEGVQKESAPKPARAGTSLADMTDEQLEALAAEIG